MVGQEPLKLLILVRFQVPQQINLYNKVMNKDLLMFVGQKAFIRKGDDVLIINDPVKGLDYPGGKIQQEETDLAESLKREVREETGLEINVGQPFTTWLHTLPAHHSQAGKKVFLIAYRCDYVSGNITLSNDHNNYSWVSKETYKNLDINNSYFKILEAYFQIN